MMLSSKPQLFFSLISMQIFMTVISSVTVVKTVRRELVVSESMEAIIAKTVQSGRLRSDVDVTEEVEGDDNEDFKSVLDVRSSFIHNEEQQGGAKHFQWNLLELLNLKNPENFGQVAVESAEPVLRCHNCSYFTHLDNSTELSSDEQCRLGPEEEVVIYASEVAVGFSPYCAITTFSNSTVTAVIRSFIPDYQDLSGRCKDVLGMKICYCDSDFCNGPPRNGTNSSIVAVRLDEFIDTEPDDPFLNESPKIQIDCNGSSACSHSSRVPTKPAIIPVLILVLCSTMHVRL